MTVLGAFALIGGIAGPLLAAPMKIDAVVA